MAQTHARPVTCSMTSIAAPSPQPPNNAPVPEISPGTTGSFQMCASSVRSSPKNVCGSIGAGGYRRRADGRRPDPSGSVLRREFASPRLEEDAFRGGSDDRIGSSGRHRRPFGAYDHSQEPGTRFDSGPAPCRGCPGRAARRLGRTVAPVRLCRARRVLGRRRVDRSLSCRSSARRQVALRLARSPRAAPRVRDLARLPRGEVPEQRNIDHEGAVAALTMGRLRTSQAIRFLPRARRRRTAR